MAHTVAYIPANAISGAAIVSLGCDEILMAPHARIGDAGPIIMVKAIPLPTGSRENRELFDRRSSRSGRRQRSAARFSRGDGRQESEGLPRSQSEDRRGRHIFPNANSMPTPTSGKSWAQLRLSERRPLPDFDRPTEAEKFGLANALVSSREELARRYRITEVNSMFSTPTWVDIAVEMLNWWLITPCS